MLRCRLTLLIAMGMILKKRPCDAISWNDSAMR